MKKAIKKSICKTYSSGNKYWELIDGTFHREDDPAVIFAYGDKRWFLNGKKYSEQDYYRKLYKRGIITREELFIHLL